MKKILLYYLKFFFLECEKYPLRTVSIRAGGLETIKEIDNQIRKKLQKKPESIVP